MPAPWKHLQPEKGEHIKIRTPTQRRILLVIASRKSATKLKMEMITLHLETILSVAEFTSHIDTNQPRNPMHDPDLEEPRKTFDSVGRLQFFLW